MVDIPAGEQSSGSVEQFGYRQELKRSLSLLDLVVYGLLVIVPTAPMATFGIVYNQSGGWCHWSILSGSSPWLSRP